MGDFRPRSAIPFLITLKLMVMTPAISMAPQKDISPSPSVSKSGLLDPSVYLSNHFLSEKGAESGIREMNSREKCRSPTLNLAPET